MSAALFAPCAGQLDGTRRAAACENGPTCEPSTVPDMGVLMGTQCGNCITLSRPAWDALSVLLCLMGDLLTRLMVCLGGGFFGLAASMKRHIRVLSDIDHLGLTRMSMSGHQIVGLAYLGDTCDSPGLRVKSLFLTRHISLLGYCRCRYN